MLSKTRHLSKHLFAIYTPNLTSFHLLQRGDTFSIHDPSIQHRLTKVLRFKIGEEFVLFDDSVHCIARLLSRDGQNVQLVSEGFLGNPTWKPHLQVCFGVLKREAMESLLYNSTQMGANQITPLWTQKTQVHKEMKEERLQKIIISACEQSKNFCIPKLSKPQSFDQFLQSSVDQNALKIYFDIDAKMNLMDLIHKSSKTETIQLMFGPEAHFSDQEVQKMKDLGFEGCRLTPTVLRGEDAPPLVVGAIRATVT